MSAVLDLALPETGGVTIHPLQPTLGAEIHGVDLRQPLPQPVRDAIRNAVIKYKVVLCRD